MVAITSQLLAPSLPKTVSLPDGLFCPLVDFLEKGVLRPGCLTVHFRVLALWHAA